MFIEALLYTIPSLLVGLFAGWVARGEAERLTRPTRKRKRG